jgi:hypothetical protein
MGWKACLDHFLKLHNENGILSEEILNLMRIESIDCQENSKICPKCEGRGKIRYWIAQDELGPPETCPRCKGKKYIEDIKVSELPNPDQLELLADWIDTEYPKDKNLELQRDLRKLAKEIRKLK